MYKSPRFIVLADKVDSGINHCLNGQTPDPKMTSGELKNTLVLTDFEVSSYALIDQNLDLENQKFVKKIFESILRTDVKILSPNSESTDFLDKISFNFRRLQTLTLNDYIVEILDLGLLSKAIVFICFHAQSNITSAKIYQLDESERKIIYISTYSLSEISSNPVKKADFWSFLKELKA